MKTNITMKSNKDRILYDVVIRQETKTSFMNLSDLQEAYTHARILNGWSDKRIDHIINQMENSERIYYLLFEQKVINVPFSTFRESVKKDGIIKVLKACGAYRTTGARANKTTWCNPYIWVLIAMELNPQLYAKVVIWLTDKLIINRIEAGDLNNDLRSALAKYIQQPNYPEINKMLNIKIFGHHETGMRNLASQEELKKLYLLESNIAFCVNHGILTDNNSVIEAISKS